jgi:epoxyqueuosine reductase
MILSGSAIRAAARECGFALVGLAPAEPLDPEPLRRWLEAGYAADLVAMRKRLDERTDPAAIVKGARTVIVLGIPYDKGDDVQSVVARYARGRDYHYAHRDRMRAMRRRLLELDPTLYSYACVDSGAAMEKAWAERAGIGFIGKNGMLINRTHGSYLTLSLMIVNRPVDDYDRPHRRMCGTCERCLVACPTQAFPSPGVVDSRRCLAYHTVENHGPVPEDISARIGLRVFGCDVCQEVCPHNHRKLPPGDPRQVPRPLGLMSAADIAALSLEAYDELSKGTPMRRIGYDGLRRNACLSLGATRDASALPLLERLAADPSPLVREAAAWALAQLRG